MQHARQFSLVRFITLLLVFFVPITVSAQAVITAPVITSVSPIESRATQTIVITGSGFGTQNPYNGDSPYIRISDITSNPSWNAGYNNEGDVVYLNVTSWTDSEIIISGFTNCYGCSNWTLNNGDTVSVQVWNPQSNIEATCSQAVNSGLTMNCLTNTPTATACGAGIHLTTSTAGIGSLWQMLALPCVPTSNSIAGALGTDTSSNLNTAHYATATPGIGWIIEDRPVSAVPAYRPLLINDILNVGTGYWLKSYQAPTKGILTITGTATPADVTHAQGCYSTNGCKAITVTTVTSDNRYNLVGNPFPYAIDWTKVRIRVDGSSSTLTPSAANTAGYIDNTVNIWNGTGYDAFTDVAPYPSTPNLQYFKSFWINVLPKAFGHTVELLIPAEQSTQQILGLNQVVPPVEQVAKLAMPWYLGWLDGVVSPAAAATVPTVSNPINPQSLSNPNDWSIRLKVDNSVTGWKDHGALLGQLHDAALGFDKHDVAKMAPFAAPYLTLVFPHPDWGVKAADYASDFHAVSNTVDNWRFEIRANPVGSTVFLSWEGNPALLKRSRLLDVATNTTIDPNDPRWQHKGYPIILNTAVKAYVWKVLAQ